MALATRLPKLCTPASRPNAEPRTRSGAKVATAACRASATSSPAPLAGLLYTVAGPSVAFAYAAGMMGAALLVLLGTMNRPAPAAAAESGFTS